MALETFDLQYSAVAIGSIGAWTVAAIGLVASVFGIWDFAARRRRRREVTWREVDRGVLNLVEQLNRDKFSPSIIVSVGRGGAIIGSMIATNLDGGRVPIAYLDTDIVSDSDGIRSVTLRGTDGFPDLKDQDVLIVVAELWSGLDLKVAFEFVEEHDPHRVRTLSLLVGAATIMLPDFAAVRTKTHPRAPWRLNEASTRLRG